jgi:hypothetical protein
MDVILRLTTDEVQLVREALSSYRLALKEKARPLCTGYSAEGIALCTRRLEVEALGAVLERYESSLAIVDTPAVRAATASSGELIAIRERAA